MANIYDGKTAAEKDNERKYLNSLVSGGGGNAEWAKSQLKQLDASSGSSNKTGSTLTTMRGTGSGSKSYTDTLKENITNSVKNPSNGIYTSLGNNSVMKDMITAYNYSTGSNAKGPSTSSKKVVEEELIEEPYNPYEELEAKLQAYKEQQEALIREQNRRAVEQGTNRLNAQKANINQAADENARQAYVQYMQSQKALPQQLASQGVSGGATETANLGLQTAYQNNVNAINQNKANRLQEIDNAIVDLQNTGDLSTVEQVLANNQAALDAYSATFDKGVGYNQWANQFNANRQDTMADQAYRDKVYKDQMTQQQWENDWFEKQYQDNKDNEEFNRVIWTVENGLADTKLAAAKLNVSEDKLIDFVNYVNKAKQLELNNTQSLINNRKDGGGNNTSEIFNTALSLLKEDGWGANDVMTYVMGQNLSLERKYEILDTLGLLNDEQPSEYVAPQPTSEIVASNSMNTSNDVSNSATVQPISINASNAYTNTDNIPLNALLRLKGIADGANGYYR